MYKVAVVRRHPAISSHKSSVFRLWVWTVSRIGVLTVTIAAALGFAALFFGSVLPSQGQIAYLSRHGVRSEIHLLDVDRTITHIVHPNVNILQPTWSDEKIAFMWGYYGLTFIDNRTPIPDFITYGAQSGSPTWSPDGQWLAFESSQDGDGEVYIVAADGSNLKQLTHNSLYDGAPAWSPDGMQLVFRSIRSGNSDLYIMDRDGGNVRQITNTPIWDTDPTWSPDGRYIAYTAYERSWDIYVLDLASREIRQLTQHSARDSHPVWSPGGRYVAFESNRDNYLDLYMMDVTLPEPEQHLRRLTNDFYDSFYPLWG
jgi:TolB protein